ncbi:helix-turn-helix domain-containing protein [Pseudomonas proteolytica]|uniref:helix-turn-helix domain-containing protein n=1 Tax=Pseudomonas proteolytica TaxID=219574 RepID=UPI0014730483|nr:helix-turn-helix domain-containing protein [Pseudomonas proteolytica]NMZ24459.1 helix-turn-helix domain-containing protein [Pseudomonas proteolytica]
MKPHDTLAPLTTSLVSACLLTTDQVATALGLSSRTLAAWRSSRSNSLPYVKTGSRVRYRSQDVAAWLESRVCSNAKTAGKGAQ